MDNFAMGAAIADAFRICLVLALVAMASVFCGIAIGVYSQTPSKPDAVVDEPVPLTEEEFAELQKRLRDETGRRAAR